MDRQCVIQTQSKMLRLAKECIDDVRLMHTRVNEQSVRTCYASSGKNMGSRGMYSPSLALKYLVGNAVPGQLLKKRPQKLDGKYMYVFDEDNRLIYAKQFPEANESSWASTEEFIFYRDSDQFSGVYSGEPLKLHALTLCEMWGNTPKIYAQLNTTLGNDRYFMELEQYEYELERLSRIKWYHLFMNDEKQYEGGGDIARMCCNQSGEIEAYDVRPQLITPFALPKE